MTHGYGDKERSYREVENVFNAIIAEPQPISVAIVCQTVNRFDQTGSVEDVTRCGRCVCLFCHG